MESRLLLLLLNTVAAGGVLRAAWRARVHVAATTLGSAWRWSVAAGLGWCSVLIGEWCRTGSTLSEQGTGPRAYPALWYAATLLSLCPPMAVLGARRPGTRVWAWFILGPMLIVLGWPVWSLGIQQGVWGAPIEFPQTIAVLLVLFMGVGNHLGTRHSIPALAVLLGLGTLILQQSVVWPIWPFPARSDWLPLAALLVVLGGVSVLDLSPTPVAAGTPYDRLWWDFRDLFGIVWARRIQDRLNEYARREDWPVRLEVDGFHPVPSSSSAASSSGLLEAPPVSAPPTATIASLADFEPVAARIDHASRWLLRRFVDPVWLDRYLPPLSRGDQSGAAGSSSSPEQPPTSGLATGGTITIDS